MKQSRYRRINIIPYINIVDLSSILRLLPFFHRRFITRPRNIHHFGRSVLCGVCRAPSIYTTLMLGSQIHLRIMYIPLRFLILPCLLQYMFVHKTHTYAAHV